MRRIARVRTRYPVNGDQELYSTILYHESNKQSGSTLGKLMTEAQSRPLLMRKPGSGPKSVFSPWVKYRSLTDTLLLYFYGKPEPAINIDIEDSPVYVMVDPDTYEIVGVHIQSFTRRFLPEHPHYRNLEVVKRLLSGRGDERDFSAEDDALPRLLSEMVVGSLMFEHRLVAS